MAAPTIHVLVIDDNSGDVQLVREYLTDEGESSFLLESVDRLAAGKERLDQGGFDVVLLDLGLPDSQGLDTLDQLLPHARTVPVVILTGEQEQSLGVEAVRKGAEDYLNKGRLTAQGIKRALRYSIERSQSREKLRQQEAHLRLLTDQMPAILWTTDCELRFLSSAGAGLQLLNETPGSVVGMTLGEYLREDDSGSPTIAAHRQALQGKSTDFDVDWMERTFQARVEPLRHGGQIVGTIGVALDITERKQAQQVAEQRTQVAAFSAAVGVAVTETDTLQPMLQQCAQAMVRHLDAALARIWTFNREEMILELQDSAGLYTPLTGPHGRIPIGSSIIGRIAQKRRPHLTNDLLNDPYLGDPDWARKEGLIAFAGHPLVVAGQLVGVMALFARHAVSSFTLGALEAAADSIAVGIHRKQTEDILLETREEFRIAQRIQQELLPKAPPVLHNFDIGGCSYPAEAAGGNFFDYIPLWNGALGIVIGDVHGHGFVPVLRAAATHASLHTLVRTNVQMEIDAMLSICNRLLCEDTARDRLVTLLFARLDPHGQSLTYSSAGHPAGLILAPCGEVRAYLRSTGPVLGLAPDEVFPTAPAIPLETGELVLLLTDGVLESKAPDGTGFGLDRALEVVRNHTGQSAQAIADTLCRSARDFCQGGIQPDDITAVVLKVRAAS